MVAKIVCLTCEFKEQNPCISPLEFCGKHFKSCTVALALLPQDMLVWRENLKLMT